MYKLLLILLALLTPQPAVAQHQQFQGDLVVFGRQGPFELNPYHAGIILLVSECLTAVSQQGNFAALQTANWFIADSILVQVSETEAMLSYGITAEAADGTLHVIFEQGYHWNPYLISHELLHVLGIDSQDSQSHPCELPNPRQIGDVRAVRAWKPA